MPFGAEFTGDRKVRFRLWAPAAREVMLHLDGHELPMPAVGDGWYELLSPQARAGSRYCYQIDKGLCVPDPASRYNPEDVHAASQVIDAGAFSWDDAGWRGRPWEEAVIYELHVGTYTPEGTFAALEQKLDYLAGLGVTAVELMPVADFPGKRNWGYDGALLFAPDSVYGTPSDLKRLVQAAHRRGLMVFLDVVYNHFGPEGNYLHLYAPQFFTERHHTPWGAAINYDGDESRTVRDFYIHNALYWLEEFHLDGLRLDAVHAILDDSNPDILQEIARVVRSRLGSERQVHLVLENDHNAAHYLERKDAYGYYDAQWNDDVHHAYHVLLSGERDGYYTDYANNSIAILGRCLSEGFAYQGDPSAYRHGELRGEPSRHLPLTAFVSFLQNHDQVGNRAFGERMNALVEPPALRAAVCLFLLHPSPPLLFMGEEWGAPEPFPFFCDFGGDLAQAVTQGRRKEFARFERFRDPAVRETIPDPSSIETYNSARLDWQKQEQAPHRDWLALYRELLTLRRRFIVPHLRDARSVSCQLLSAHALQAAWRLGDGSRLTVYANLGAEQVSVDKFDGQMIFSSAAGHDQRIASGVVPAYAVVWYSEVHDGAV